MVLQLFLNSSAGLLQSVEAARQALDLTKLVQNKVQQIDAIGLLCPLPILRFKKRIQGLNSGTEVDFLADDPSGRNDLLSLCEIAGHRLMWMQDEGNSVTRYRIAIA